MDEQTVTETPARKVFHKLPAQYKRFADVDMERDIRIRLFGKVVEKSETGFMLSDGFSTATIHAEKDATTSLNEGDYIRVFARVLITEIGPEFRAELIQDMAIADADLYNKVFFE